MTSLLRVVRLSLRHRGTVAGAVLCAVMIGVLWGGNIGAVFPFVEVVFRGQSLQECVEREIEQADAKIGQLQQQLESLRRSAPADESTAREGPADVTRQRSLQSLQTQLLAEQSARAAYQRAQPYVQGWLPRSPFSTLVLVIALLLAGTLLKGLFTGLSIVLTERLAQVGTVQLRKRLFRHSLDLELQPFQQEEASQLMSRLTFDLEQICEGLRALFGRTLGEPLKMVACLAGAAYICWRLLLISLVLTPLALVVLSLLSRSLKRANKRVLEEMSSIYSVIGDSLRGIKIVKAFTMERLERRRADQASRRLCRKAMRVALFDALVRPTLETMGMIVICVAILAGAYLVLNEKTHLLGLRVTDRPLSISSMMLFFGFLAGTSDPARKFSGILARLQRAAAAADRVYELLDRPAVGYRPARPRPLPLHRRLIHFQNVSFAYDQGLPVLQGINLKIRAGETVAIVGPNGCGKSTLAGLLLRFYVPQEGAVRVDGLDLRKVRVRDLRRQVGLVTQESVLFNDSVAANIRVAKPDATRDEIVEAARRAQADHFIRQDLSHGYQTVVGEGACRLSGGQKQRIALARAILRNPRILVLDEATSQVDLESEQQIHAVLADFIRDRTTLIVTHRLSILHLADRIVVMDRGRIADMGTYDDLLLRSGIFRRLCQAAPREAA